MNDTDPGTFGLVIASGLVLDEDSEMMIFLVGSVGLESFDELVDPPGKAIVEGSNDNPFKLLKLSSS